MIHSFVPGFTRQQFIETFYPFIAKHTKGTGLLPELVICQAILESSGHVNGRQLVGGSTLSRKANNYFGIKCSSSWNGGCYNITTKEHRSDGSEYYPVQPFRIYTSVEASILDHIKLLTTSKRYKGILQETDPYKQFLAVQAAGYATATTYAPALNGVYNSVKKYIDAEKKKRKLPIIPVITIFAMITAAVVINSTPKKNDKRRTIARFKTV